METTRRFYSPLQRDAATFIKTATETNGEYTLIDIELAAHGGNALHYHSEFSEQFEVLEGELNVQVGDKTIVLKPGETALAPRNANHRFFSTSDKPTRFLVTLRPGHPGFEKSIQIGYGLATDGQARPDGTPKDPFALGFLFQLSGTRVPGLLTFAEPILGLLAGLARRRGLDRALEARYVTMR